MYEHFQGSLFGGEWTSSPEGSPASHSATQGSEKAETMNDISFRQCWALFGMSDRYGSSLKTFAGCLVSNLDSYSRKLSHRWKAKATRSSRFVFLLQPSMPRTGETGFGLLGGDEMTLATPTAVDHVAPKTEKALARERTETRVGRTKLANLRDQIAHGLLLTPTASENEQDLDKFKARMEKYPNGTTMPNLATQRSALPSLLPTPRALEIETGKNAQGGISLTSAVRLIPTPTTNDVSGGPNKVKVENGQFVRDAGTIDHSANLQSVIHGLQGLLPTPATRDFKGANSPEHLAKDRGHHDQLPNALVMRGTGTGSTLRLEPAFVEWMMAFPMNWTSLEAETTE